MEARFDGICALLAPLGKTGLLAGIYNPVMDHRSVFLGTCTDRAICHLITPQIEQAMDMWMVEVRSEIWRCVYGNRHLEQYVVRKANTLAKGTPSFRISSPTA